MLRQLLSQYPLHAETQYVLDGEKGQRQWKPKIGTSFLSEESYVTYIVEDQEKVRPVQLNREKSNLSSSFFSPIILLDKIEGCEHFSEEDRDIVPWTSH